MAEEVQTALERMLPELEEMQRTGLLTPEETKSLVKKRKGFEYKIRKFKKRKEDFLAYIDAEVKLVALLRRRRRKTGFTLKKREIEYNIKGRIRSLFRTCLYRHQADLNLWWTFIAWLKKTKQPGRVSQMYIRMLAVHGDKPEVFLHAAKDSQTDIARRLLLRGLKRHTKCSLLYIALFELEELEEAKKVVIEEAVRVGGVEVAVDMLEATSEEEEMKKLVFEKMEEFWPDEELTWDTKARMVLEEEGSRKEKISNCVAVYEEAMEHKPTELMRRLYTDTMVELGIQEPPAAVNGDKPRRQERLTEKQAEYWTNLVDSADSENWEEAAMVKTRALKALQGKELEQFNVWLIVNGK